MHFLANFISKNLSFLNFFLNFLVTFFGSEKMGVSPVGAAVHVAIAAWPWGAYLGNEGLEKGIKECYENYLR